MAGSRAVPGVCMATSGPGATNLVTGIANAFLDSVPMVAITGQVPSPLLGTDAFQEVDIFGITMPVVKHSFMVRDVARHRPLVDEAFEIAQGGRPGPVLVDFPKDISVAMATSAQHGQPAARSARRPAWIMPPFEAADACWPRHGGRW